MSSARTYDRVANFRGGMDSYRYPAELDPNQSQLLSNMVVLDSGRAITRAGCQLLNDAGNSFPAGVNPIQSLAFLDIFAGNYLIAGKAVGGTNKLYSWNGATWSAALAYNPVSTSWGAVQGADVLLFYDPAGICEYWDGTTFTKGSSSVTDNTATHAPSYVTTATYIAGMFVCAGSAMVQGTGGGTQTFPPDALVFSNYLPYVVTPGTTPTSWNNTQSFRVGNGDGEPIIGLAPIQSTASTSPIYNLAVLKQNSVWVVGIQPGYTAAEFTAFFASFATSPQGDQVGTGIGCVGSKAFCLYQNDLLFMSQDGVQSLQRMQAAAGQYQLSSPLSEPIQPYIDRINWSVAYGIQAIKYRNLAIFFVPLDNSTTNNYALVWNGLLGKWMVWTGWTPTSAIVTRYNGTIELVFGDSAGNVNFWKDSQNLVGLDSTYLDNGVNIPWQINTRSFVFGSLDFLKKARATLIRFNQGNAVVNISAYLDLADSDDWNQNIASSATILGVNTILPFQLTSAKPVECYRSLEGTSYFNELYVSISSAAGWADVRGLVVSAYLKSLRDPAA